MVAPDVATKRAIMKLLDELPADKLAEVLDFVQFLKEHKREPEERASHIEVRAVPAAQFKRLAGLVAWGGDAVKDTENLYDE